MILVAVRAADSRVGEPSVEGAAERADSRDQDVSRAGAPVLCEQRTGEAAAAPER